MLPLVFDDRVYFSSTRHIFAMLLDRHIPNEQRLRGAIVRPICRKRKHRLSGCHAAPYGGGGEHRECTGDSIIVWAVPTRLLFIAYQTRLASYILHTAVPFSPQGCIHSRIHQVSNTPLLCTCRAGCYASQNRLPISNLYLYLDHLPPSALTSTLLSVNISPRSAVPSSVQSGSVRLHKRRERAEHHR